MKKCLLILLLSFLLSGCANAVPETTPTEETKPAEMFLRESSEDLHDPGWTEQELLTAFYQYAEMGTVVIDCVMVENSQYDVVGVVQYTTEDDGVCQFDFIKGHGIPRNVGVHSLPAGDNTLECAGDDTVTCRLLNKDGTEYTCTISYYEKPENKETGFQVVSG